jgi:hypothetical protein
LYPINPYLFWQQLLNSRGSVVRQVNMEALLAVKAHKARCLKILTVARKALEDETDKLIDRISVLGVTGKVSHTITTVSVHDEQQAELQISPGQPFTPSPTINRPPRKNDHNHIS